MDKKTERTEAKTQDSFKMKSFSGDVIDRISEDEKEISLVNENSSRSKDVEPYSVINFSKEIDQQILPTNSLFQPVNGVVPPSTAASNRGYQANMRLLFQQRPESAASHRFNMKSRPASAISRFSVASRFDIQEEVIPQTPIEIVTEDDCTRPTYKKSAKGPFKNKSIIEKVNKTETANSLKLCPHGLIFALILA